MNRSLFVFALASFSLGKWLDNLEVLERKDKRGLFLFCSRGFGSQLLDTEQCAAQAPGI